ncbi:MAG: glycosyltransferase [Spirochaetaceae bacterium]|jgi:glycosyltransferase involved in cell wall biosynthesis|nr:glycosyltransferase [Spirochaetaceae bacterium]
MVIVFVIDNYLSQTDGTHISAHRFREELIRQGHTVRVLSIGVEGPDMFGLGEHYIPVITPAARQSHLRFARFDRETARRALEGADVVHTFFPWQLQRKTLELAREMGVPVTGAFHCPTEHITYNMGLKGCPPLAEFLYWLFRVRFYRKVENIHCPSAFTAAQLQKRGYTAKMHVISNGVSDVYRPAGEASGAREKSAGNGAIHVMMAGRLAPEKRQDLIIRAAGLSRHRERIRLHFTGQGACLKRYRRLSAALPNPPEFGFVSPERLLEMMQCCDIYIHASDVEAEGLACLEAFSCGAVPIISDSPKSAASQFALDARSIFRRGDCRDLRDKLDWWIEHPEERRLMGLRYARLGERYRIKHSAGSLLAMFAEAMGKG